MAKNRTQLEKEAKDLGIDFSEFETNAEFSEAIAAAKEDSNEEDRPVNTDTDNENPQDDQADIEAPMDPEDEAGKGKKGKKAKSFTLKTSKAVSFIVNGVKSEGTEFEFKSEDELAARKQTLVERYGAGVVEE